MLRRWPRDYEEGGARALSILTDQKYFQGHLENIKKGSVRFNATRSS